MSLSFQFAIASDLHIGLPHTIEDNPYRFHRVELSIPIFEYVMDQLRQLDLDDLIKMEKGRQDRTCKRNLVSIAVRSQQRISPNSSPVYSHVCCVRLSRMLFIAVTMDLFSARQSMSDVIKVLEWPV